MHDGDRDDYPGTVSGSPTTSPLVKSKQRVAEHGEVFTPAWLVEDMINLVADEANRIESRFLEPACGSGNFLVPILKRKLNASKAGYGSCEFKHRHNKMEVAGYRVRIWARYLVWGHEYC